MSSGLTSAVDVTAKTRAPGGGMDTRLRFDCGHLGTLLGSYWRQPGSPAAGTKC